MSKYGHVTILSSVPWDFMWQRHHAIAATLAASGRDVTFVEPHPRGIGHISSWVVARLRRHGSKASESTVKHAVPAGVSVVSWTPKMHLVDFCSSHTRRRTELASSGMVIAYLPSQTSRKHIERIRPETLVYDCVLDWQNAPAGFYPPAGFREFEQWITELSKQSRAAIISDSVTLAERFGSQGVHCEVVYPAVDPMFRFGAPDSRISKTGGLRTLGYFGSVRYDEIDVELINRLAATYTVVIVGSIDTKSSAVLSPSVEFKPPMDHTNLITEIGSWDAIILPYRKTRRTSTLVPAKLWNTIATRLPVYLSNLNLPIEIGNEFKQIDELLNFTSVDAFARNGDKVRRDGLPDWEQRVKRIVSIASERGRYSD